MASPSAARQLARFVVGLKLEQVPGAVVQKATHDPARLQALMESLGQVWELEQLTLKPYPCGSIAQPYMDCALRLREQHRIRAEEVSAVRCRTAAGPLPRLWEPLAAKQAPPNGYAAKFSLPYLVGVILVKGRAGLAEFTDEFLGNVALALSRERAERLVKGVDGLAGDAPLTDLLAVLAP